MLIFPKKILSKEKAYIKGLFIILGISICFGIWFKTQQLSLISTELVHVYPFTYWLENIATTFLLFTITWVIGGLIFKPLLNASDLPSFLYADSLSYLSFIFVSFGISVKTCVGIFFFFKFIVLLSFRKKFELKMQSRIILRNCIVAFLVILLTHILFSGFFSPSSWDNSLAGGNTLYPVLSSIYKNLYVNAKRFNFHNLDYSYWGATFGLPTGLYSFLLPFLTFFLDLPSIDVESFHRILHILTFVWCVAGSFGFYLFLYLGIGISSFISLLGGMLFVFSNPFLATCMSQEFPLFHSMFLMLPYVLLIIRLAFRRSCYILAALSGFVLTLPFYILAPHPEEIIHSFFYLFLWLTYLILFNREERSSLKRLKLGIVSVIALILGSLSYIVPVIHLIFSRETYIFGHAGGGIFAYGIKDFFGYFSRLELMPFLTSGGLLFVVGFTEIKNLYQKKFRSDYFFFVGMFLFFLLLLIPGQDGPFAYFLKNYLNIFYFLGIHRIAKYFSFTGLILSMFGLNSLLCRQNLRKMAFIRVVVVYSFLLLLILPFVQIEKARPLLWIAMLTEFFIGSQYTASIYIFLMSLLLVFCCIYVGKQTKRSLLIKGITIIVVLTLLIPCFPSVKLLKSKKLVNNPKNCKPYITLQTLMANYLGLKEDKSNLRFLRKRLLEFEQDLLSPNDYTHTEFAQEYYVFLKKEGVSSAARLKKEGIWQTVQNYYSQIDTFYLEEFGCIYKSPPVACASRGVPDYNTASLYLNIKDKFQRILVATTSYRVAHSMSPGRGAASHYGVGPGLLIFNSNYSVDTINMNTYPPLHAFYDIFNNMRTWNLSAFDVLNPQTRKVLNIAGVDIFTLREEDYLGLGIRKKASLHPEIINLRRKFLNTVGVDIFTFIKKENYLKFEKEIYKADLRLITANLHKRVDPDFVVLENQKSYGLAYLARSIKYIDSSILSQAMERYRLRPQRWSEGGVFSESQQEIDDLKKELLGLKHRYDILIEDEIKRGKPQLENTEQTKNYLSIENFIGNRAAFKVHCEKEPCVLVFNMAAINGWKAFSDSESFPIKRANLAFMGVEVPLGDHLVWFEHRPDYEIVSNFITLVTFLICFGFCLFLPPES